MTVNENEDDYGQDDVKGNGNGNGNGNDHDHEIDEEEALEEALELDTQSQIFLEMRRQNLDLLKIAAEVSGYTGQHPPLRSGDLKNAMKTIWDVYSEFYAWIDPEETDDDEDDEDDDL